MAIISFRDLTYSPVRPPLFDQVEFHLEAGERVCIFGRNGSGKSTLLRLVSGEIEPDEGRIFRQPGIRIERLPQEVPPGSTGTVREVVGSKLPADVERHAVDVVCSRLGLEPDVSVEGLSGGLARRVLLARTLVGDPDLVLLDEPTNHLDVDAIVNLEDQLVPYPGTILFVTHDRRFLQRVATRIVEIDRGGLRSYPGSYSEYRKHREKELEVEVREAAEFDKKLAREEAWIRQGIQGRRTRNEGRVRALEAMRRERGARRERSGPVRARAQEGGRSGVLVLEAKDVWFGFPGKTVLEGLSTTILRGDRVGVVGPNGSGKTTLLRVLLGDLSADRGTVRRGTNLKVCYFDQLRESLDEDASVVDNVGGGNETVTIDGRERHLMGYLQDFLFSAERARIPVRRLSGGERNRVLFARLFTRPSNVLVLDEPTNDLDVETLELLEDILVDYSGTLLLITHDREFLENVVTSTLVLDGKGRVIEHAGGDPACSPAVREKKKVSPLKPPASKERKRRMTYREQKELEGIPERIEGLEAEQADLYVTLSDPAFYQSEGDRIAGVRARASEVEEALTAAYARWEQLDRLS